MKTKTILRTSFLLCLLAAPPLCAQYAPAPEIEPPLPYTFTQFGHETWSFVKSPGQWDLGDWAALATVGVGTYLLIETADDPLRTEVMKNQRYALSVPMEFGRMWG